MCPVYSGNVVQRPRQGVVEILSMKEMHVSRNDILFRQGKVNEMVMYRGFNVSLSIMISGIVFTVEKMELNL